MSLILAKLRAGGLWIVVGLAALLLVVFGLWRHATRIISETKKALADSEAREKAARESATRQAELAGKTAAIDTRVDAEVKAIAVKHDAALTAAAEDKRAAVEAQASGDADDVVALAKRMRAKGQIE